MEYKIRPATHNDLPVLKEFEQGLISAEHPFDPTIKRNEVIYYDIIDMIDNPDIELVVADQDGELIGCGYVRIEKGKIFERHEYYGYLGFMYVKPLHRGKGINNRVMDALKQRLQQKGITELRLQVYKENESAIQAYKKVGFNDLLITMRMEINGPNDK